MQTLISKKVMEEAINLSAEWNNTGFVYINESGVPEATVWQSFKYMDPQPETIAYVNGNDGFVLQNKNYVFEVDPKELL
jgi:hypothetical protein